MEMSHFFLNRESIQRHPIEWPARGDQAHSKRRAHGNIRERSDELITREASEPSRAIRPLRWRRRKLPRVPALPQWQPLRMALQYTSNFPFHAMQYSILLLISYSFS